MSATMVEQSVNKTSPRGRKRAHLSRLLGARLLGVGLAVSAMLASSVASAATVADIVGSPVLNGNGLETFDSNSEDLLYTLYNTNPVVVTFQALEPATNPVSFFMNVATERPGLNETHSISFLWQQSGSANALTATGIDYEDTASSGGIVDNIATTSAPGSVQTLVTYTAADPLFYGAFSIEADVGGLDLTQPFTLTVQADPSTSPVPLPAAAWLFASAVGLTGLLGGSRRKQRAGV
jgi:hypothetical protein